MATNVRVITKISKEPPDWRSRLHPRFVTLQKVWRTDFDDSSHFGASFSRYFLPHDANEDDFEFFAQSMDETLLEQSSDMLRDFHSKLQEVNNELGMYIDGSFASRLLEYGRQRVLKLQRLGLFNVLLSTDAPKNRPQEAVRTAFELGMAATEHRWTDEFEDYLFDGMAMADWRKAGLPAARAERLRQGKRTRTAILRPRKLSMQRTLP